MKQFLRKLTVEDSGQDLIEYALVAALVALSVVVAVKSFSTKVSGTFNTVGTALTSAL